MKHLTTIIFLVAMVAFAACSDDIQRTPSKVYVPDMMYSRAYETYAERDSTIFSTDPTERGAKIFYNNKPVAGTMARGEELSFPLLMDVAGVTTSYDLSKQIKNPITTLTPVAYKETERLYLIYCGICHGVALDGNGPLFKDGDGPFPAKPAMFVGDSRYENMPEGQMFYSVTYGKNMMGSYASQLSAKQRWMIIRYIKDKQKK